MAEARAVPSPYVALLVLAAVALLSICTAVPPTPRATLFRFSDAAYGPCPRPANPTSIVCAGSRPPELGDLGDLDESTSPSRGLAATSSPHPKADFDLMARRLPQGGWSKNDALDWARRSLRRQAATPAAQLNDLGILHWRLGERSKTLGDVADALGHLDSAWRSQPDSPVFLFNRAVLLEHLGQVEAARAAWTRFLQVETDRAWRREAESALQRLGGLHVPDLASLEQALLAGQPLPDGPAGVLRSSLRELAGGRAIHRWLTDPAAQDTLPAALDAVGGSPLAADTVQRLEALDPADQRRFVEAHALYAEGLVAYEAGERKAAGAIWRDAEPVLEELGAPVLFRLRILQSVLAYYNGEPDASINFLDKLLAEPNMARYPGLQARCRWLLALNHGGGGDLFTARELLQQSLETYRAAREPANEAVIHSMLAEFLQELGRPHEAWRHRLGALSLLPQVTDGERRHNILYETADALQVAGHDAAALPFLDRMVDNAASLEDPLYRVESLIWRARVRSELGQTRAARFDLDAALEASSRLPQDSLTERLSADAHWIYGKMDDLKAQESLDWLSRAESLYRDSEDQTRLPHLLFDKSLALTRIGHRDEATQALFDGLQVFEAQRRELPPTDLRISFFDRSRHLFDALIPLLLDAGRLDEAWRLTEASKARHLKDLAEPGQVPSLAELQGSLPSHVAVLELVSLQDELLVWLPGSSGSPIRRLPVPRSEIEGLSRDLVEAGERRDIEDFLPLLERAYKLLIAPLADDPAHGLSDASTWIVVPDRGLHLIPFDSLRVDGSFLFERRAVVVSPSITLWTRNQALPAGASRQAPRVVSLGIDEFPSAWNLPRLPAAEREARAVADIYPGSRLLIGDAATRDDLIHELSSAEVLHLATHAEVHPEIPARSFLAVGDSPSDSDTVPRPLFAHELYDLKVPQLRLAVLAACRGAGGPISATEGPHSLARPFLAAGVPQVVAPLWNLDDALSAELLPRFHRLYASGLVPEEALRRAKIELLQEYGPSVMTAAAALQVLGAGSAPTPSARP